MVSKLNINAVRAFPPQVHEAVDFAMNETDQRIQDGFEEGRLDDHQFAKAQKMMTELKTGLTDMAAGKAHITSSGEVRGGQEYFLETPSKDRFRVVVRDQASNQAQARIGIKQLADNGRDLPKSERIMIRVDRDNRGASVDLQMGVGKLDSSVHGYMLNKHGKPIQNGKRKIANHHFRGHLPKSLKNRENFAQLVRDFQAETIAQLQVAPREKPVLKSPQSLSRLQKFLVYIGLSKGL